MNCALSFSRSRVSDPPAESRSTTARTSIRSGQDVTNFSPCAHDLLRPVGVEKRIPSLAGILWLGRIGPAAKPENQASLDWSVPGKSEVADAGGVSVGRHQGAQRPRSGKGSGCFWRDDDSLDTKEDLDQKSVTGQSIGPYELRELLATAGWGRLYCPAGAPGQTKVALQVIKPGMDAKDTVARF